MTWTGPLAVLGLVVGTVTGAAEPAGGLRPSTLPAGTARIAAVACAPQSTDCWAVGGSTSAFVVFSPDGGATWSSQPIPGGWSAATAISCPSRSTCYVAANSGTAVAILTTADGGSTWTARPFTAGPAIGTLACPSALRCYASPPFGSAQPTVYVSTDGASTWSALATPAGMGAAWSVSCLDGAHCWAAGAGIAATADGGATWTQEYPTGTPAPGPGPPIVYSVSFGSANDGWAVGGQQCGGVPVSCPGAVLRTTDGGRTWAVQESLPNGPFLTQLSCHLADCSAVGTYSFSGGSELLTWSGDTTPQAVGTAQLHAGGSNDALAVACESWGCVVAGGNSGGGGFVLTSTPVAFVARAGQPWLTRLIPTFDEVSWRAADVGRSALVALALLLVIGFPGQIFNSTLMAHYDEVEGWLRPLRDRLARLRRRARKRQVVADRRRPAVELAAVFILGGLFGALLDPDAAFDRVTLESFAGILLATAFTTTVYTLVRAFALHRVTGLRGHMRVYSVGVGIAAACLLISRVTAAEPGYLYGVLLGYDLGRRVDLPRHHAGRIVGVGALAVLVISVSLWLLWTPVHAAAIASPDPFFLAVLGTAMPGVFLGGLTSLMFGLLPLRWLDGEKLLDWRRPVWAAAAGLALFLFVHVVLRNAASAHVPPHSLVVTVALFAVFGVLSIAFWSYFRFRPREARVPA